MKRVIFPLIGALFLGFNYLGKGILHLLYDEDKKEGIFIEMCRPWERRRGNYPYQNSLR
ncbi:hypothetical protein Desca_2440 [Desulfotomaculum nigrificans CO-1-SRB]|uniref:Uncharacterized protein n=1 Tax=Desulfotomaculum nigrificans (strain DSM 14880 / VKM B-2319 / CO-1-SRB) TaxID=868595 RepID=F6B491_DESCC|nr:hypothetical protein [Desulfotomaculum nigrificans]AEF95268.1 hypothetical protein Desca_2440 [Desulfotomaculum nigrificans CO-1-SRB]